MHYITYYFILDEWDITYDNLPEIESGATLPNECETALTFWLGYEAEKVSRNEQETYYLNWLGCVVRL